MPHLQVRQCKISTATAREDPDVDPNAETGSTHVSVGKRILEKFEWWRFEPHPEWLSASEEKDDRGLIAAAAGIPGEVRMFYFAKKTKVKLQQLDPGAKYVATFISPLDGQEYPLDAPLEAADDGTCAVPRGPINQDWVLVLRVATTPDSFV